MSSGNKKVLLFIKAPSHNLKPLEAFLSKRNFIVHSESEIKEALIKALELQPDFIFVAWDHPNPKINQVPTLINQSIMSPVVAYIMSNTKEATRKLNICPINPKLYPPISGPAIERLVLKSGKAAAVEKQRVTSLSKVNEKNNAEIMKIKSSILENLEKENIVVPNSESDKSVEENEKQHELNQKMLRNKSIDEQNNILKRSSKINLSDAIVNDLKNSFKDKVTSPLESILENLAAAIEDEALEENSVNSEELQSVDQSKEQAKKSNGTIIQKGLGAATELGSTLQKGLSQTDHLGTVMQKNVGMGDDLGSITEKNVGMGDDLGSIIEKNVGMGDDLGSIIEKKSDLEINIVENAQKNTQSKSNEHKSLKAYCMSIYSDTWCGYLVISTDANLDFSTIDLVFTDWIKLQFNNLQEIDEYDFFEFKFIDQSFIDALAPKADYFEQVTVRNYTLNVLFFPIDPTKMTLELNDEKNLIQITTEDVPSDVELNFSLHLHLPENKKYLLYTQVNKSLSLEQKNRLLSNRVHLLFTPIDFEKEYKKFIAEKNVKELYSNMKKKLSAI